MPPRGTPNVEKTGEKGPAGRAGGAASHAHGDRRRAEIERGPQETDDDVELKFDKEDLLSYDLQSVQRAAAMGDKVAQTLLGYLYGTGQGVPQDFKVAARWWRLASDQGFAAAHTPLGCLYRDGDGVSKDAEDAVHFFRLGSDAGITDAHFNLGCLYMNGEGVEQDLGEAARLWRLASDAGLSDAHFNLGALYREGRGVGQDLAEAARLFQLGSARGETKCQNALGCLFITGSGVLQDFVEARRLFELAAAAGDVASLINLGQIYEHGSGVEKNVALAKQYYRRAGKGDSALFTASGGNFKDTYEKMPDEIMKMRLDVIKHTCATCKTISDDLKVCSRCKGPRYCSVACQRVDWAEHKRACQQLAKK